MATVATNAVLGGGVIFTEGEKSNKVGGVVLIDPTTGLPSSLSGGGGGSTTPAMTAGGNVSATTSATGANWVAYGSQLCKQLTVSNQTGAVIEVRQDGAGVGLQIPTGAFYTFFGLTNANQLGIRRVDQSNTQVAVTARWES